MRTLQPIRHGFPCLTDGKADAHVRCVRPALAHDNVTLRTHAKVERLEDRSSGNSVKRVVVDRRGTREVYRADIVVVSCGATNSAALLLRSASDEHPQGLANSSDVVGRHYMAHINSGVIAISQTPNTTQFQKTLGINDYYFGDPTRHADDSELPLGHIQMLGKSDKASCVPELRGSAPGSHWTTWPSTRLLLADHRGSAAPVKPGHGRSRRPDPGVSDLPQPRAAPAVARQAQAADGAAGLPRLGDPFLVDPRSADPSGRQRAPVRHGPLRDYPTSSALDVDCRAHDVDNLYVVDTSFFPSSSAVNPALTAMANALRRRRSPARTVGGQC